MGDKTMKKIAFLLPVVSLIINADSIDEMVNKIKADRKSVVDKKVLTTIPSPIPVIKVVETNKSFENKEQNITIPQEAEEIFVLKGIMNNMAFINDSWVKKGQKIGKYTLADIMDDAVYLKSKKKSKMIFLKTEDSKIKITGR
jgi:hypothetical protein